MKDIIKSLIGRDIQTGKMGVINESDSEENVESDLAGAEEETIHDGVDMIMRQSIGEHRMIGNSSRKLL